MDGDSTGALLGQARKLITDGEERATRALSQFSLKVPTTVGDHDGMTIYAGGDDLLAMLPLDSALKCAMELAGAYRDAFRVAFGNGPLALDVELLVRAATLSGAIVYAHYHTPLRDVLQTAHQLLDDVAKDATGRDSLAIAVFKSSGITAQWSAPWQHIRQADAGSDADNIIDVMVRDLTKRDADDNGLTTPDRPAEFSSGLLYNVRDRFAALTDKALTRPGEFGKLSEGLTNDDLLAKVLEADYLRGLSHRGGEDVAERNKEQAQEAIQRLLRLCQQVTRVRVPGSDPPRFEIKCDQYTLGIDGALLVRFLASDGKEDAE
ncbi:MAG: hypothetical protein ABI619_13920 [Betaproteobacteria bacterium]